MGHVFQPLLTARGRRPQRSLRTAVPHLSRAGEGALSTVCKILRTNKIASSLVLLASNRSRLPEAPPCLPSSSEYQVPLQGTRQISLQVSTFAAQPERPELQAGRSSASAISEPQTLLAKRIHCSSALASFVSAPNHHDRSQRLRRRSSKAFCSGARPLRSGRQPSTPCAPHAWNRTRRTDRNSYVAGGNSGSRSHGTRSRHA